MRGGAAVGKDSGMRPFSNACSSNSAPAAGSHCLLLIHYLPVSDWRQIQARIRKARTSADPPGQLAALYERTHDAMVAFELAQFQEKAGVSAEAVRWYTSAAERFRRAQWKQKAEEALTRLGAPIPVELPATPATTFASEITEEAPARTESVITEFAEDQSTETNLEADGGQQESVFEPTIATQAASAVQGAPNGAVQPHRRKRRGRRGGRGRNKALRTGATTPVATVPNAQSVPPPAFDRAVESRPYPAARGSVPEEFSRPHPHEIAQRREHEQHREQERREQEPAHSAEPAVPVSSFQVRARSGDPALSSRMVQLESQLRRMLACANHAVDQADEAPAGPGVFLITDSDQTTYYYVEACQTLRVGIGNLMRSGRSSRDGGDMKAKLAEHLGINEARVGKYLKDHCVVRWLQLDDGAPLLAHFSVAVLRPIANE